MRRDRRWIWIWLLVVWLDICWAAYEQGRMKARRDAPTLGGMSHWR